jgi:hypothetical protein
MSLRSKFLSLITALLFIGALTSNAVAGDEEQPQEPEANPAEKEREQPRQRAGIAAKVKAAKAVEEREPSEVSETFAVGDTVFVWSRIDNGAGTTIRHVWKRDGNQVWERSMEIGSHSWRTWSRSGVSAGAYTVEVVGEDDTVLGQVAFTVE